MKADHQISITSELIDEIHNMKISMDESVNNVVFGVVNVRISRFNMILGSVHVST